MHVLAIRHVRFEHVGMIAAALRRRGISVESVDLPTDPEAAVHVEDAAGLILMGGPMSANDDLPYIRRELELIQQAAQASKPILGICLGAQLIAEAFGARVFRNPVKEIGWYPIYWTEAAADDALFSDLSEPETVFHWHSETFDLPHGSVWLARSEACAHQAFRMADNIYGFQFHLEVTPGMIAGWIAADLNRDDVRELDKIPDPNANAVRLRELSLLVFGRWVGLLG